MHRVLESEISLMDFPNRVKVSIRGFDLKNSPMPYIFVSRFLEVELYCFGEESLRGYHQSRRLQQWEFPVRSACI